MLDRNQNRNFDNNVQQCRPQIRATPKNSKTAETNTETEISFHLSESQKTDILNAKTWVYLSPECFFNPTILFLFLKISPEDRFCVNFAQILRKFRVNRKSQIANRANRANRVNSYACDNQKVNFPSIINPICRNEHVQ